MVKTIVVCGLAAIGIGLGGCDHGPVISYPPQYYFPSRVESVAPRPPVYWRGPSNSYGFHQRDCDAYGRCSELDF